MEPTTKMTAQGIRDLNRLGPTKKERRLAREKEIQSTAEKDGAADAASAPPTDGERSPDDPATGPASS